MNKYLRFWMKTFTMAVSEDLAYKWNFMIKCFALILVDFIGPLIAILIYTTSAGIPGWSFEEFILFTGTVTFVLGVGHAFMFGMPWRTIDAVRLGEFDRFLVKPMNTLALMSLSAWDLEGFAEIAAGLVMIIWAGIKLAGVISLGNFMLYLLLLFAGIVFVYASMVLIGATSFLVVKSFGLFDIFFNVTKFARYPLNVFGLSTRVIFTFIFPLAVAAHYPTTALLHGMATLEVIKVIVPVGLFLIVSLIAWRIAVKKYSSAGG